MVADSIVRGNSSKKIVEIVREAGAKKVYFASGSPPIISQDPYGIDLPTTQELIAANKSNEQIRKFIGADGLFYADIEKVRDAVRAGNKNLKNFSDGCFTKQYPTPEITPKLLKELGGHRNDMRGRHSEYDSYEDRSAQLV